MTPEQPDVIEALREVAAEQKRLARAVAVKSSSKDFWDKFASLSISFSRVIVAGVAAFFTYEYDAAQVRVNDVTVLEKFIPHLASRDTNEQKLAVLGLSALGDTTIAVGIAKLYPTEGTFAGLKSIAENGNPGDQALAKDALREALASCPISGEGGDPRLNALKNRFTAPLAGDFVPSVRTPADTIKLPSPSELKGPRMRADWPDDKAVRQVTELESEAVTIEGYLRREKMENIGTGESSNCHMVTAPSF